MIIASTFLGFMLFSAADASAIKYSITYDDNVVSDMPTDEKDTTMNDSVDISGNTPTRAGYTFLKWCSQPPASDGTCPGAEYSPGAALTINGVSNNEYKLYAMWEKAVTIADASYMQDVTACPSSLEAEKNYTLKDSRDDQDYTVAKLADGKCWMTTNLNLAGGTEIEGTKSDVPEGYTLPTDNGFQSGNKLPASSTSGFRSDTTAYVYNSGNKTNTCTTPGCYSYYSWTAATAGSGLSITEDNTDAEYSICPNGWHLPSTRTGTDDSSDFRALMIAYGGSSSVATYNTSTIPTGATIYGKIGPSTTVPSFLLTGYYYGSSSGNGGSYGYYWSATSLSSTYARRLVFDSSSVSSAGNGNRRNGFAVRCVFGD